MLRSIRRAVLVLVEFGLRAVIAQIRKAVFQEFSLFSVTADNIYNYVFVTMQRRSGKYAQ